MKPEFCLCLHNVPIDASPAVPLWKSLKQSIIYNQQEDHLSEYLQVGEHVGQAELTEVVLIKDLKILASVLGAIFVPECCARTKHNLNPGQFEVDI